ncbi:MAG: alpha/beta hydrolase family protein [Candidatus Hodarchaeales archaeon]|jgi:dipeptidyl aminopeptidase/acylaminoacyl peptidase
MKIFPYNPITEDPETDQNFPALLKDAYIDSHGSTLLGRFLVAQGNGPHPTIVFLHGFPGHELNIDLAQIFRRVGWNSLVFHYRGSWGSKGSFSFENCLEDVHSVLKFLKSYEISKKYRVDIQNIVLIGFSMGGFASLMTAAQDPSIKATASIAGVNFSPWANQDLSTIVNFYQESLPPLAGTSAEKLLEETINHKDDWNILDYVNHLSNCQILLVGGKNDDVVPISYHHNPLVKAIKEINSKYLTDTILEGDHVFSNKRITLAKTILSWLKNLN